MGKRRHREENPFEAEEIDDLPIYGDDDSEEIKSATKIRKKYLTAEVNVKSVGFLYFLGAALMFVGWVMMVVLLLTSRGGGDQVAMIITSIVIFLMMFLMGYLGYQLRQLNNTARIVAGILAIINVLYNVVQAALLPVLAGRMIIPLAIGTFIIVVLLGQKGAYVTKPKYHRIIKLTPHIKYKVSIIVKIFVWLLVILFSLGIIAAIASALAARR